MATVGQINEQDVFTCPICLETLNSPKSLPCLHTFCETCIGEFILSTEQRAEQKLSNYSCPVCRTVVTPTNPQDETSQWAASLPHNLAISSLMDISKSVKQECHLCKRRDKISEATQWCRDCTEAFCEECLQMHSLMKLFANHKVVQIEGMDSTVIVGESSGEPDSNMISDLCPFHPSKVLEAFCFDHQELCCVFCLTLIHRKCENVKVIEDIKHLKKDRINALVSEVTDAKVKVETMIKERRVHKAKLDTTFTEIQGQATTFILSLKDKLDSMLALFTKELNITREDSGHEFKNKLQTFETLSVYFDQLLCRTQTVQKHGTLNQMFIHFEKSKTALKTFLADASQILNTSSICEVELVQSAKLSQMLDEDCLGEIAIKRSVPLEMKTYSKQLFPSKCSVLSKTHPAISFDNIILKHYKTLVFPGFEVYGGVFVSDQVIVVGGADEVSGGQIKAVNILNERILDECILKTVVKRLAYDIERKSIFVSCYNSKILSFSLDDTSNSLKNELTIKDDIQSGGLCVFEGFLYAATKKAIQKINLKTLEDDFEWCFDTDENCTSINGLEVDSKNKRLLHTSNKFEVVCTSMEGKEIFRHKDWYMKEAKSLAVHSEGFILVGDAGGSADGSIHVISEDGKRRRTVLDKCKKKERIRDICFDRFENHLAIFEPSYIEIYDICDIRLFTDHVFNAFNG